MKKIFYILLLFALTACDKSEQTTANSTERKKNEPLPPPPCGRVLPDPVLTNISRTISPTQMALTFDPVAGSPNYILFYQQNPVGSATNYVTIDGVSYRQATAGYHTLPMYVNWGWAPMYLNVIYNCRIGIYYSGGCYSYSAPFTLSTFN